MTCVGAGRYARDAFESPPTGRQILQVERAMAPHAESAACVEPSRTRDDRAVLGPHGETAAASDYGMEEAVPNPPEQRAYRGRHRNRNVFGPHDALPAGQPQYRAPARHRLVPYGARGYAQEIGQDHHDRPARTRPPGSALWPRPVHWPSCQSCNRLTRYRWLACEDCYWLLCILCHRAWRADLLECPCGPTYLRDMT